MTDRQAQTVTTLRGAGAAHRAAALRASLTHGDPPACLARRQIDELLAWASSESTVQEVTR